jgi:sigma-E factor negative regulatory protein RseB
VLALGTAGLAGAQPRRSPARPAPPERGINEWLLRMQDASRKRNYVGTFVVSSGAGAMSSARIWHVATAGQQIERVESSPARRAPPSGATTRCSPSCPNTAWCGSERRESLGLFPNLLKSERHLHPRVLRRAPRRGERVAGFDADVVQLRPRTAALRLPVWSEKRTGLVIKLQTLDADGNVLEQVAFSELQLDAPLRADRLAHMMRTPGRLARRTRRTVKTSPAAEGWAMKSGSPASTR